MAKFMNNSSSSGNQLQRLFDKNSQTSFLASCYSVNARTSGVTGFHYCATSGAGKTSFLYLHLPVGAILILQR